MRQLPPLKALRAFEATARHESLTMAADELGVTHSAVSQQVKILEAHFGQRLFERQGRTLRLTPRARAYLEDVRACLDRLAIASEQLRDGANRHIVRINTTPSFAMRWLIPTLPSFQVEHPRIEVRVMTSPFDTIEQLADTFDVIIRRDAMRRPGYRSRRFLDDISTPVLKPDLLREAALTEPARLREQTLLHLRSRPDAWGRWFHTAGVEIPETLSGPYFDHFFLSLQAAINGMGIALAPEALIKDDLEQDRLVRPFPDITISGPGFHCLHREEGEHDRGVGPVLDWLLREGRAASDGHGDP